MQKTGDGREKKASSWFEISWNAFIKVSYLIYEKVKGNRSFYHYKLFGRCSSDERIPEYIRLTPTAFRFSADKSEIIFNRNLKRVHTLGRK
jgi:hypothetical protein